MFGQHEGYVESLSVGALEPGNAEISNGKCDVVVHHNSGHSFEVRMWAKFKSGFCYLGQLSVKIHIDVIRYAT